MIKGNAFMRSAKRAQDEQKVIQRGGRPGTPYKSINIRIPADLHQAAMLHRVDTGESITALITRLLTQELDQGGQG